MNPSSAQPRTGPKPLADSASAHEIARRQAEEEERRGRVSRRDFISQVGAWLAALVFGAMGAGTARVVKPDVLPEPSKSFGVGPPSLFPSGEATIITDDRVAVFREGNEFWAMTMVCTHLGCTVAQADGGFRCPCHGSYFDLEGHVKGGPAPRPLQWWKLSLSPGGQLIVHADQEVPVGTKFRFEV